MKKIWKTISIALVSILLLAGCGPDETGNSHIKGKLRIDGSATVSPVTQAVVEEFSKEYRQVEITIGVSGTGGGFKKFINGETDIQNASRQIKEQEIAEAKQNGVEYYELEIGKDAIVFAVNEQNTWAKSLTEEQLVEIWKEDSTISKWSDIDPSWPEEKIKFYAPGNDSGTYDYFHSAVMGEDTAIRSDVTASQDMNVLVTGVQGDLNALGFFGFVYYEETQDKLNAVAINGVEPSKETISSKEYTPLSRGLYIYVNKAKYQEKEALQKLVEFYLDHAAELTEESGYPSLTPEQYEKERKKLEA